MVSIKISDHPYSSSTYHKIDSLARAELKAKEKYLQNLGMSIKMAPEIEFTVTEAPDDKNHLDLLAILQKSFKRKGTLKGFRTLRDRVYEECIPDILEVTAKKTNPTKFVDTLKANLKHIANVAKRAGFGVSFFDQGWCQVYPTVHTNFSLWDGKTNLFAKKSNGSGASQPRHLMSYVVNRLINDLNKAIFLFSSGSISYTSLDANYVLRRFISWYEGKEGKASGCMILHRDADSNARARGEFRFSEPSGVESAKALFFVNSICDSLDTLIKHYSTSVEQKRVDQTVAEVLETCLEKETQDKQIMRLAKEPISTFNDSNYKVASSFNRPDDGLTPSALPRFKNSTRMQELMGKDLHKLLCTTVA